MNEWLASLSSMGGVGILAGALLLVYRNDRLADSKRRCDACQNLQHTVDKVSEALAENNKVISELHGWLKGKG